MWWEILKRQVASTKGKQFQLDFNQPMIEDSDCKKEFTELVMKARMKTLDRPIELIDFGLDEDNIYYILYKPKLEPVKSKGYFLGKPDVKPDAPEIAYQIAGHAEGWAEQFIDGHPIPEEVYCKALELYKSNQNHEASVGDYNIRVGKRTGAGLPATYTIQKECMIYGRGSGRFENPAHGFKITFREKRDASHNSVYPEIVDDFNKMVDSI